jgi:hypothetical protein
MNLGTASVLFILRSPRVRRNAQVLLAVHWLHKSFRFVLHLSLETEDRRQQIDQFNWGFNLDLAPLG